MKKILPFFSYLFHPLFIPLFSVWYFFYTGEHYLAPAEKILITLQVVIIMILIPVAFFFLLRTLGKIDGVMVSEVGQRKWPLIAQIVLIFLLIRQSITADRIPELYYFFLGILMAAIIGLISAFVKFKMSLHLAAMAAMVIFVIGLSIHNQFHAIVPIAFLFAMTGMVASSRLQMEAHDYKELIAGLLAGLIPQIVLWHFWL